MNRGELMTINVRACAPTDSLDRAAQLMWEGDCGCVPVVDAHGFVLGVLTDRDICMAGSRRYSAVWQRGPERY